MQDKNVAFYSIPIIPSQHNPTSHGGVNNTVEITFNAEFTSGLRAHKDVKFEKALTHSSLV